MKTFLNGLTLIVPTAVILYLFVWILKTTEIFFSDMILLFLPAQYYVVGMGLLTGIVIIFITGLLLKLWIVQKIQTYLENIIEKMPLLGAIYRGMKDLVNFFSSLKEKKENIVVLVDIPSLEAKVVGFITTDSLEDFDALEMEDPVAVYLQMSYQMGGYTLFIPKKNLTITDMDIVDASRFVMTAGVSKK